MGNGVSSCCDPGECCGAKLKIANLDGPAQESETRTKISNVVIVHVGSDSSERLKQHLQMARACAIEVEVKVLRGKITGVELSVNTNKLGGVANRKLVPLPVAAEMEMPLAGQAWGGNQQGQFNQNQQNLMQMNQMNAMGQQGLTSGRSRNLHADERIRLRLLPQHTNGFEVGDYYLSCNAIEAGSITVTVTSMVEMSPGAGLQKLDIVTHQQKLLGDLPTLQWGKPQQQFIYGQQPAPAAASPYPANRGFNNNAVGQSPFGVASSSPYGVAPPGNGSAYDFGHNMTLADAQLHIRNLESEIFSQNNEIASLKKQNRALDEKVYQFERNGGRSNANASSTELQLNRYKEYILKAKEVIAQQKERIVDLETTTMVGRLEAHLLEYKEYASRQKIKLAELSEDFEAVDRELRESRAESDELRARYHLLKRDNSKYRDEVSPRRTPHYSQRRNHLGRSGAGLGSPSHGSTLR